MVAHEFRWRKTTDIEKDGSIFELLCNGVEILDVSLSDLGILEVAFHNGICNEIFAYSDLEKMIKEGLVLAMSEHD